MKLVVAANKAETRSGRGDTIFIQHMDGPLNVVIEHMDGGNSTLDFDQRTAQLRFTLRGIRNITFFDRSGAANNIEFFNFYGEFLPSADGIHVVLDSSVNPLVVETAPGVPLEVVTGAAPLQANIASVTGPLPVTLPAVTTLNDGTTAYTGVTTGYTIAANPARRRLVLKALKTNTGIGWVGQAAGKGYALEAGESLPLTVTAAVKIFATVGGDTFAVIEEAA